MTHGLPQVDVLRWLRPTVVAIFSIDVLAVTLHPFLSSWAV
jgi:hypothetical protein